MAPTERGTTARRSPSRPRIAPECQRRTSPGFVPRSGPEGAHKPAVDRLANSILGRSPMTGAVKGRCGAPLRSVSSLGPSGRPLTLLPAGSTASRNLCGVEAIQDDQELVDDDVVTSDQTGSRYLSDVQVVVIPDPNPV